MSATMSDDTTIDRRQQRGAASPGTATDHDGLARALDGTPLAYGDGHQLFMGIELLVDPGALVPRAETELLGRTALSVLAALDTAQDGDEHAERHGHGPTVVDMCCGAGNLACAIAVARPDVRVHAADLTDGCVQLSRRNVARLGLGERVSVHQGDLFAALDGGDGGTIGPVDVIVANPPYISSGRLERDRAELARHEPRAAFDGGPYGLTIHQRLVREAPAWLHPGGWLLFELGAGQARQVERLFTRSDAYQSVRFERDATGEERVAVAQRAS